MPIILDPSTENDTFLELLTELYGRGFDYLSQDAGGVTRAKRWINQAYHELCEAEPWPFLADTVTGTAPLEIADLSHVLYVVDSTNESRLVRVDPRTLTEEDTDLTTTGTPTHWYMDGDDVTVFPVASVDLSVRYIVTPPDLEADDDECLVPKRYSNLIVDGACVMAYRDSDNFQAAVEVRNEWEKGVERMRRTLLVENYGEPAQIGSEWWGG